MRFELVTRRSCHLCSDALIALQAEGVEPELVDVDTDQVLFDLYDFRVPVILVDGKLALEGRITRVQIRQLLTQAQDLQEPGPRAKSAWP